MATESPTSLKLDLVITLQGSGFVILFGNGNGTFQSPVAFSQPSDTPYIAVGPLTKGGPPSIVLASSNVLYLYFGNGAGVCVEDLHGVGVLRSFDDLHPVPGFGDLQLDLFAVVPTGGRSAILIHAICRRPGHGVRHLTIAISARQ